MHEKMKQNVGAPMQRQGEVTELFNFLLADEYQLYVITRRAHRDTKETNFNGLDKFFEIQFEILEKIIQSIGERVDTVGRFSPDSLNDFLKVGRLNGSDQGTNDQGSIIDNLIRHHKLLINLLHNDIIKTIEVQNDSETASFLSKLLEQHEKVVWMLGSHL